MALPLFVVFLGLDVPPEQSALRQRQPLVVRRLRLRRASTRAVTRGELPRATVPLRRDGVAKDPDNPRLAPPGPHQHAGDDDRAGAARVLGRERATRSRTAPTSPARAIRRSARRRSSHDRSTKRSASYRVSAATSSTRRRRRRSRTRATPARPAARPTASPPPRRSSSRAAPAPRRRSSACFSPAPRSRRPRHRRRDALRRARRRPRARERVRRPRARRVRHLSARRRRFRRRPTAVHRAGPCGGICVPRSFSRSTRESAGGETAVDQVRVGRRVEVGGQLAARAERPGSSGSSARPCRRRRGRSRRGSPARRRRARSGWRSRSSASKRPCSSPSRKRNRRERKKMTAS